MPELGVTCVSSKECNTQECGHKAKVLESAMMCVGGEECNMLERHTQGRRGSVYCWWTRMNMHHAGTHTFSSSWFRKHASCRHTHIQLFMVQESSVNNNQ